MTAPGSRGPGLFRIGVPIVAVILLLGGCLALDYWDRIPMSAARPPGHVKTLDDFRRWKGGAITGQGTFESGGVTYTVLTGPAGRSLASGPSAYLFDPQGQFVDWTADMGDCRTVRNRFDLTRGYRREGGR